MRKFTLSGGHVMGLVHWVKRFARRRLALAIFAAAAVAAFSPQAAVAQSTYTFTGAPYDAFVNFTACADGNCANFTTAQFVTGSFQTSAPLPPNLVAADVMSLITAYSFNDGVTTYSSTDGQSYIRVVGITTDANGAVTRGGFSFARHRTATPTTTPPGQPYGDPNTKIDFLNINGSGTTAAFHNMTCATRAALPQRADACATIYATDDGDSEATSSGTRLWVSPPPVVVAAVPTMSEWAMILLGLMLAGFAALTMRSRPV